MKGKNCVAIASDHRLGAGRVTVGTDFPKVFEMGPALFLGLPGLTTDSLTVYALANLVKRHRSPFGSVIVLQGKQAEVPFESV